jgi:hypothetical protein
MTYSGIGGDGVALIRSEAFSDGSPLRVVALFIPVLVAAVATCAAWQHAPAIVAIAGCLLAAVSFIGGFSIGGAYAPAAAIVLGAAGLSAFLEKPATSALEDTTNDGTS